MQSLPKHIQFQLAFNAQVIGLCHDNELFGNAIITNTKLIHIPSHPKIVYLFFSLFFGAGKEQTLYIW
jgi:hypothetical protein